MKTLFLSLIVLISTSILSQNVIEVSINKIGTFDKYGKDSLHLMIKNSECGDYHRTYKSINSTLIINKNKKKIYRFKDGSPFDTIPIKKIEIKDSIYTITVIEKRSEYFSEYEGQLIECYLILDTRKNQTNKKVPTLCYFWNWDIFINDEPTDYYSGQLSDYVIIK